MNNIEIRDFTTVSGVGNNDYVVLSLSGGSSAKVVAGVFRSVIASSITPSIKEGVWWIGDENTLVNAEGKTPEFRRSETGIEYRYTGESDSQWKLLVGMEEIRIKYSDLTEEQQDEIRLKYSDLTEEQIAELQKPALDMIDRLEETDSAVSEAEEFRVAAEKGRVENEVSRVESEEVRNASEKERVSAEETRNVNEEGRVLAESYRASYENERVSSENRRESNEASRIFQESARVAAEKSRETAEASRVTAEKGRSDEFSQLKSDSVAATLLANETAEHPTYIGTDNYVYKWNRTAKTYDKTSIYVRGEAFSIKKVYASIDDMYADTATSFKEGDFCLINTGDVENAENAQLFVRNSIGGWDFLVDMSGAIGFTGKTPQFMIGNVEVGSGKSSAEVTLFSDGTDTDGNPKYRINYVIPCLAYEDLTAEQISDLQRPASDMIAQLSSTDSRIKENEEVRQEAERNRESSESLRASAESIRETAEKARSEAEAGRVSAENEREKGETNRVNAESVRKSSEEERAASEKSRVSAENTRVSNEDERKTNELSRTDAEEGRIAEEELRVSAENSRILSEQIRVSAEEQRVSAEKLRSMNEDARVLSEESRAAAEKEREASESERKVNEASRMEEYSSLRKDMEEATKEVWDLSAEVRNVPKIQDGTWWIWDVESDMYKDSGNPATGKSPMIQNGTWWTWDDVKGEYSNTGQSVSSDYLLTKDKVEGVLTGDIDTHTHTHLVYRAQVYDTLPDLSSLVSWTGDDGMSHEFVYGNDIYIKDVDEPTGYANYKLAATSSGNAWVKIPQIPDGFRMVLVKSE